DAVVELGGRPAPPDRELVPRGEAVDELLALVLPLQLGEAYERLGHLAGLARGLGDELEEQVDGLEPELLALDEVPRDAGLALRLQGLAQVGRQARAPDGGHAVLARRARGARADGLGGGLGRDAALGRGLDRVRHR